jgi:uncharacterized protein YigE (DUF2233 family)
VRRLALLSLALLAACNQPASQENGPVIRFEIGKAEAAATPASSPAPERISACVRDEFEGVALTHCVADPAQNGITTALSPEGGGPYRSFAKLAAVVQTRNIAFAVNGGMFGEDGKPIGYYVEESNRLRALNRADGGGNFHLKPNGVFFGTGSKWQVLPSDTFFTEIADRPEFGTQSGPMLVIAGKLHPEFAEEGPSKLIRNGVGIDAKGRAHFVISEGPVSFGRFARYFRDELKTPNALYLDGSVSSLWDPAKSRMDSGVPLGPLIVVTNRAKASP